MQQLSAFLVVILLVFCGGTAFAHVQIPATGDGQTAILEQAEMDLATGQSPEQTAGDRLEEVSEKLDSDPRAQQARESIIGWIYQAAEYLSFPAFYWVAFAAMVAGLVSYGLQLLLGKLVMLIQFHFSLTEILADGLGFVISALGLVLTTQAAAENSAFIASPAQVLSATALGVLVGLVFYIRGQTQEYREAREVRRRNRD
jgi:hypothetical protein